MLEQDFEKLLAAYFEEELDEAGLTRLRDAVRQVPARRRRFQRELRLHTLLRETATVLVAREQVRPSKVVALSWPRWSWIAALATCLVLGGLAVLVGWNFMSQPERIGRVVDVVGNDGSVLWRQGRQIALRPNTVLRVGDRVTTGFEAQTVLRLEGAGKLTLQGRNTVELFARTNPVVVFVEQGQVLMEAVKREPGQSPLLIRTPRAMVEVVGTVFGLEVEPTATRVLVHEGQVAFADPSSGSTVQVGAGEYSVSGGGKLEVLDQMTLRPDMLLPGQYRLLPAENACLEKGRSVPGPYLKVEGRRRTAFLKFHIAEAGAILSARLRLTQMVDPGSGTLEFWEGSHSDWSRAKLSAGNAPQPLRCIASRTGRVVRDQIIEVDVSRLIRQGGTYTVIMTLDAPTTGDDIWFGSRESLHPPELTLIREP
jgi:ferric-dicitrate binding protein FerR (iron transport regulator)